MKQETIVAILKSDGPLSIPEIVDKYIKPPAYKRSDEIRELHPPFKSLFKFGIIEKVGFVRNDSNGVLSVRWKVVEE